MSRRLSSTTSENDKLLRSDNSFEYHQTIRGKLCSIRYRIALLGFLGFVLLFSMRVIMSIAIVDMVVEHKTHDESFNENCPEPPSRNASQEKDRS